MTADASELFPDHPWCARSQHLKWRAAQKGVLPMASGEHDFKPNSEVFSFVQEAIRNCASSYGPLKGLPEVLRSIASFQSRCNGVQIEDRQITLVPSATIALALLTAALVKHGDHVLFLGTPIYYAMHTPVASVGAEVSHCVFPKDEALAYESIRLKIRPNTKAIYICNPHSPTGRLYDAAEMYAVGEICQTFCLTLVSDDVYEHMTLDGNYVPAYKAHPYLRATSFVISSYAKCFNVTGVSASFLVSSPYQMELIEEFYGGPVFMTSVLSQLMVQGCVEKAEWISQLKNLLRISRDLMVESLRTVPQVQFSLPPSGMFVWAKINHSGQESANELLLSRCQIEAASHVNFHYASRQYVRLNFGTHPNVLSIFGERISNLKLC